MKIQKSTLLLASTAIVLGVLSGMNFTAHAETSGGYEYSVHGDSVSIDKYTGSDTTLIIPKKIDGKEVNRIEEDAFANCNMLESVTIPEDIEYIGDCAFFKCKNLSSINLPEKEIFIGTNAFYQTAYYKNSSNWKNNMLYIGDYLINANEKLKGNVVIDNEIKYIASGAFVACKNLESITIPESITSIPSDTFNSCTKLKEINLSNTIEFIGTIRNCNELTTINYNGTIEQWKKVLVFYDEAARKQLEVHCTDGDYVQLSQYEFDNYKYSSKGDNKIEITKYEGRQDSLIIPNQIDGKVVSGIGERIISSSYYTRYIKIPNTVTYLGDYAFAFCDDLLEVVIPSSVTKIGKGVFQNSNELTSIYYDGTMAQWKKIDIKDENEILEGAQVYCSDGIINEKEQEKYRYTVLEDETISIDSYRGKEANLEIPSKIDGRTVTSIRSGAFGTNKNLKSVVIPNTVTEIGENAFEECIYLEKVVLPNNIDILINFLFKNCVSLKEIEIPNSVKVLREETFYGCYSLEEIKIPDSVTEIGNGVFSNCDNLTKIEISSSVTEISENAFNGCRNLQEVNYTGTKKQWKAISISDGNEVLSEVKINCSDGVIEYTHTFDDGKITVKPTCTTNGKRVYTCINCGETKEEVIKTTGHKFGNNQPKCSVCGTKNPNYKETVANPSATTLKSVKAATKSLKVTWTKVSNVDGYQVQYTTDSKFKKSVKTVTVKGQKVTSYTISNLKANQKYYVRVCTYKKKLTSKWSSTKNATTPVQKPAATTLKSVNAGKKSIKVTWKKTSKVNGYQILVATNNKFTKNTKTITITKQSTVSKNITSLKAKSKYYVKVRTYDVQTVNGKKMNVYSNWSKVKTVTTK